MLFLNDQITFETKKVIAKLNSMQQLEKEKELRSSCEILSKQVDKYKETLPTSKMYDLV
jgi:hypothetical protein